MIPGKGDHWQPSPQQPSPQQPAAIGTIATASAATVQNIHTVCNISRDGSLSVIKMAADRNQKWYIPEKSGIYPTLARQSRYLWEKTKKM